MKRRRPTGKTGSFLRHLEQGKPYCMVVYRASKQKRNVAMRVPFKSAVALVRHKGASPFIASGTRAIGAKPYAIRIECYGAENRQGHAPRTATFVWDKWQESPRWREPKNR